MHTWRCPQGCNPDWVSSNQELKQRYKLIYILKILSIFRIVNVCNCRLTDKCDSRLTLLGIRIRDWPFFISPLSTLPMTTVPMSLYFSSTGIRNGPSILRFSDGRLSMNEMNGSPLQHNSSTIIYGIKNNYKTNRYCLFIVLHP